MFDKSKIIPGLIIFLAVITYPAWYMAAHGKAETPKPEIVTQEKQCIESTDFIRANHMHLLTEWRAGVRSDMRVYQASDGREFKVSLTGTCLDCHSNKAEFCDKCHGYAGVQPDCWSCHVVPESK